MMTTTHRLTPTQDLIMELVAARYRLGEPFWTVEKRHMRAITGLADLGLVTWRAHNASPHHVYVTLTDAGRKESLSPDHVPPILRDEDRIAQAIGDPGSIVKRDPGESVTRWSTRAVINTLLRAAR